MILLNMGSGMDFDSDDNTRDVAWLGDCDEGCQLLADKLGWGVSMFYFTILTFKSVPKHSICIINFNFLWMYFKYFFIEIIYTYTHTHIHSV